MPSITLTEHVTVELIDAMGDDTSIVRAAQVSLKGANEPDPAKSAGLINYLMREKHGSPFEQNALTFYVKAPIFVFREFMRHRIASYNEVSGRYSKLVPEFFVPDTDRPLVNVGTSARPEFAPGSHDQVDLVHHALSEAYQITWDLYETLLGEGVANEVARMVLPVGVMSQMYVTMNLRGLLNFLSLRTHRPGVAVHVSRPQREIELVAEQIEAIVTERFPLALEAFNKHGRVAP